MWMCVRVQKSTSGSCLDIIGSQIVCQEQCHQSFELVSGRHLVCVCVCVCVCVRARVMCVCACREREGGRTRDSGGGGENVFCNILFPVPIGSQLIMVVSCLNILTRTYMPLVVAHVHADA